MKKNLGIIGMTALCCLMLAACSASGATTMDQGRDTDGMAGEPAGADTRAEDTVKEEAGDAMDDAKRAAGDVTEGAGSAVKDAAEGVGNAAKDVVDGAENAVKDAADGVTNAVGEATNAAISD